MSSTNAPFYNRQSLAWEAPNGGAFSCWLDNVDSVDVMSILSDVDLINHPAALKMPTSIPLHSTLQSTRSTFLSTPIRSTAATFRPITLDLIHSDAPGLLLTSTCRASSPAESQTVTPVAFPSLIPQRFALNIRRDGFSRRQSTHQHPLPHSQLQPRTIISRKASCPTSKRPDRRRSRTYWPVWYQKQRRRERKEAARNMKLDEQRRLELMELWEDEFFQILMYLLTEHLKRAVLALAREFRRQLERLDEIELERLDDMEDLG